MLLQIYRRSSAFVYAQRFATKESPSMNSNDDQSSVPATKIREQRNLRRAKSFSSRGIVFAILFAALLFAGAPRFAAQTPSAPPATAQAQQQSPQQATPAAAQQQ